MRFCASSVFLALAKWDCSDHLQHILCLIHLASHVTLLAQYHVSGFLQETLSLATSSRARHEIMAAIATAITLENCSRYQDTLASCGCDSCICTLHWSEGGARGSTVIPCTKMEVLTKFAQDYLVNVTPTFLPHIYQYYFGSFQLIHGLFRVKCLWHNECIIILYSHFHSYSLQSLSIVHVTYGM